MEKDIYGKLNQIRIKNGFLTIEETFELSENGNTVFDPFSVLISKNALIGTGNIFYPSVVFSCAAEKSLSIGSGNIFMTGCTFSVQIAALPEAHKFTAKRNWVTVHRYWVI